MFQDTLQYQSIGYGSRMNSPNHSEKGDPHSRVIQIEKKLLALLPAIMEQLNTQERLINQLQGDNDLFRKIQQKLLDDIILMKIQLNRDRKQKQQPSNTHENKVQQLKDQFSLILNEKFEQLRSDFWEVYNNQINEKYHDQNGKKQRCLDENPQAKSPPIKDQYALYSQKFFCYQNVGQKTETNNQSPKSICFKNYKKYEEQTNRKNTKKTISTGEFRDQDYTTETYLNSLNDTKRLSQKQLNDIQKMHLLGDQEKFKIVSGNTDLLMRFTSSQSKFLLKSPRHQKANSFENFDQLLRIPFKKKLEYGEEKPNFHEQSESSMGSIGRLEEVYRSNDFSLESQSSQISPLMESKMNETQQI